MKTIKFMNTRKWGNTKTYFHYNFGMLSVGIIGFTIDIIIRKKIFKEYCKRINNMGLSKCGSTFPFKYNDIF